MGFSLSGGSSSNYGLIFVPLKSVDLRTKKGPGHTAADIYAIRLRRSCSAYRAVWWLSSNRRPFRAWVTSADSAFELQDLGRNTLQDLDRVAHQIIGASRQDNKLIGLYTSYTASDPQLLITIDRVKAKALGVSVSQISSALSVYMGSAYVNDFNYNNRSYRVYVQARQSARMTPGDLRKVLCAFRLRANGDAR